MIKLTDNALIRLRELRKKNNKSFVRLDVKGGGSGAASTITCSPDHGGAGNVTGDIDIISFMVHYTGGTNTQLSSYKVFVTKNGGYTQGSVGV